MTSNVVQLHPRRDVTLDKRALAKELGCSVRTVENRMREGMPCLDQLDRFGRRRYKLAAVLEWLEQGRPEPRLDRLSLLERRVRELEERLQA